VAVVLVALIASNLGAQDLPVKQEQPRGYTIPAQALETALDAYIRASGVQVFYETSLTRGRRSFALKGDYASEPALDRLLFGTGLAARRTDVDAFVIMPAPAGHPNHPATATRAEDRFMAALQTVILDALCRTSMTRPGGYKVAIQLWISPVGAIQRSELVGSTGDLKRDGALPSTLLGASIRMAPPANLPQPFILSIAPRSPRETGDCPE
jgi:secretin/TonB-like protein